MTSLPYAYPLTATFRVVTLSPELQLSDASGQLLMQVKQKLLTLREDTTVFADVEKTRPLFRIKADRITGFRAVHTVTRLSDNRVIGAVRAAGLRSIWRARYDVTDADGREVLTVQEENPWTKIIDGLVDEIPVVGWIIGMFVNPSYVMKGASGEVIFRVRKRRSFFERRFELEQVGAPPSGLDPDLVALALVQVVFLERDSG